MEVPDEVTPEDFEVALREPLGENWERVKTIFDNLGEVHHRSMTVLYDLATQKDRVEDVTNALERAWDGYLSYIPDPITTHVEIKMLFDAVYGHFFQDVLAEKLGVPEIKLWTPGDR